MQSRYHKAGRAAVALALLAATACTHVEQATAPSPQPGANAATVRLLADGAGKASLTLAALGISRRAAFTLQSAGFAYGTIGLVSDSTLAYLANSPTNWAKDSGSVTVCQGGGCAMRTVVVTNSLYAPAAAVVALGTTRVVAVAGLGTVTLANLQGLEPGAVLDQVSGYLHLASISADSLRIQYGAVGGLAQGYYIGWDQLSYRVRRTGGLGYYTGTVQIVIPDTTTLPQARPDVVTLPSLPASLPHSQLLANDLANGGAAATSPTLRLSWQLPALARLATQAGVLADTLLNGQPSLYYRRTNPAARADTLTYYMQDGADDRITKAKLILSLP